MLSHNDGCISCSIRDDNRFSIGVHDYRYKYTFQLFGVEAYRTIQLTCNHFQSASSNIAVAPVAIYQIQSKFTRILIIRIQWTFVRAGSLIIRYK